MEQFIQHASEKPIFQDFTDSLEDFGQDSAEIPEPVIEPEDEPEIDPSISLHPDELERLKQDAFHAGKEEGERATEAALSQEMSASIANILTFMEQQDLKQRQLVQEISDSFLENITSVIQLLMGGDLSKTTFARDFGNDLAAFAKFFKKDMQISCNIKDENALSKALEGLNDLTITAGDDIEQGHISLRCEPATLILDKNEWAQTVRERVTEAVQALIQLRQ